MALSTRLRHLWAYAVVVGITVILATVVIVDDDAGVRRIQELEARHEALARETRELEAQRDRLALTLERVESGDVRTIEEIAREKNMIRPGDTVYRVHYRPLEPAPAHR